MTHTERAPESLIFPAEHPSDIARLQIEARDFAEELGFTPVEQTLIATAVSELATNIIRYARCGTVRLEEIVREGRTGIGITAEDAGPGIEDPDRAVNSDYSSGNSLGLGLPSVKQFMDSFVLESEPGKGTRVAAEKWRTR